MRIRTLTVGLALAAGAIGLTLPSSLASQASAASSANTFAVDGVHSSVVFRISHLGVSYFYGRFNRISGEYTYDAANPAASSFVIAVAADSVDTNNEKRDRHLKSPDFFNAAEYPELRFGSTSVEEAGEKTLRVTGDLTLHGVTRPITVDLHLVGIGETPQGFKSGFHGTFTIERTDFGMDTYVAGGGLGDEVTIMFGLEGRRK